MRRTKRTLSSDGDAKDIQAYARELNKGKKLNDIKMTQDMLKMIINIARYAQYRLEREDAQEYFDEVF